MSLFPERDAHCSGGLRESPSALLRQLETLRRSQATAPKSDRAALSLVLASSDELNAIAPQWVELWRAVPDATVFQHPSWQLAWWEIFGSDKELVCPAIFSPDLKPSLLAIMPLCILRDQDRRRKLMFVGAGLSDSLAPLIADRVRRTAPDLLLNSLARHSKRWDLLDLQPVPGDSPLCGCWEKSPWRECSISSEDPHIVLPLPGTSAEFEAGYSPHFRERIRNAWRRGEKMGGIQFEPICGRQSEAEVSETVKTLIRFRRERWRRSALDETRQTEAEKAELFFERIAQAMNAHGLLRLYRLLINGQTAAVLMGFVHRRKASLYLVGFDPAYSKASPGTLVLWHAIRDLIREGAAECDFLRGQESYKERWGGENRPYFSLRLHFTGTSRQTPQGHSRKRP